MAYPKLTPIVATGATDPRYLADRFADKVTPRDFGAAGDGTTDDSAAFAALEEDVSGKMVDLCGLSYAADAIPCKNLYFNGTFVVSGKTHPRYLQNIFSYWNPDGIVGSGVGNGDLNYYICDGWSTPETIERARSSLSGTPHLKDVIAIGNLAANGAIKENVYLADCIAIGSGVMSSGEMTSDAQHNIGIGQFALRDLTSGDRNIAIGSLAFVCSETIKRSIAIGRDCAQTAMSGDFNVLIGYQTVCGIGAGDSVDGKIRSMANQEVNYITAVGARSLSDFGVGGEQSNRITAVGACSAQNLKAGTNSVFIGCDVCSGLDRYRSYNNKTIVESNEDGTYLASDVSAIVTLAGHSAVVDRYVIIKFNDGPCYGVGGNEQVLYVSAVSGDTFTLSLPASVSAGTGTCTVVKFETNETPSENSAYADVVIGSGTLKKAKEVYASVVVCGCGLNKENAVIDLSVVAGDRISDNIEKINQSVIIGHTAGPSANNSYKDVFIGTEAGKVFNGPSNTIGFNTAIGDSAMSSMIDGSTTASSCRNSTALGYGSKVSGSNQVQLGNSGTTTYAYGSVQNRSDARDKTEVRDTILGLDFLLSLRPVDFKWDFRDDYIETVDKEITTTNEDGSTNTETVSEIVIHEKDGSKKRNRFHHGFIAQEVKAAIDSQNIDFGGYQDHKINGGNDILTLGYEEFIAPMVKAIQQLNARLVALEGA